MSFLLDLLLASFAAASMLLTGIQVIGKVNNWMRHRHLGIWAQSFTAGGLALVLLLAITHAFFAIVLR